MGKMRDVATDAGRTILFVSHNLGALPELCKHVVLIENGMVKTVGPVADVIRTYLKSGLQEGTGPGLLFHRFRQALPVRIGRDFTRRRHHGNRFQLR